MHPLFQPLAALGAVVYVWETTLPLLEAPRPDRARSEAQIEAFEIARSKRAANLSASAPPAGVTPPEPAADPPAPATPPEPPPKTAASPPAPTTPPPKRRGSRSDKGKKRGYLVRTEPPGSEEAEPSRGYMNFVIV